MKDYKEVIERIKLLAPETLESYGVVQRARKSGYICPFCRDGTGEDGTGMETKLLDGFQSWFCGKCEKDGRGKAFDNIDLLAAHFGKDVKRDFKEVIELSANLFNMYLDETVDRKSSQKPALPDKYKSFIENANVRLKDFVEKQGGSWRGLSFDTLNRYLCGVTTCSGQKDEPALPHFVIPTSFNHCLVRLIGKPEDYSVAKGKKIVPKPHWGSKEIFGLKLALNDDPIIFITEGEFDAMSIWQATGFNVISICGSALSDSLRDQLKHIGTKNFIVLLDNDQTGKDKSQLVVNALNFIGHNALSFNLSDKFKDANEFLCADAAALTARLKEIYAQAKELFAKDNSFDEHINSWRENNKNAPVDTTVKADIKAAYKFLENVTIENLTASLTFDISTRRKVALCKFYIPQIANKFFGIFKAAQKNATEKIKNLREQKPPPDISPELQELADLKIGDFGKAVEEFFNQIKKDQKAFAKKYKEEQEKREGDAKRKAFLENRLSTQKIMGDCPIDLFLPDNVYFSAHEVGTQTFTQNGNVITKTAAKTPIIPVKILREPKKRITQYVIAIKAKGVWGFIEVYGDEIADTKKVLRLATEGGALIKDARQLCNYLTEMIAANEDILIETKCYQQTGWLNGKFDKFIYPTGSDDYVVRCDKFNFEDAYAAQGNPNEWKKVFIEACNEGGAVARIFFGNPLCAPLVLPLELPNLQTHLIGVPDCGKSGALKLAASIFGNPKLLKRSFASTIKNRQRIAAINANLPTFLDELGTVHGGKKGEESLAQMVYDYFEGINNQINSRDGTVKEMFTFSGSRVSCAEHEMLKAHDAQGAFKRLLQLYCPKQLFKIKFAKKLHTFTNYNFGHFGKVWTDFITTHQNEMNSRLQWFYEGLAIEAPEILNKYESTLVINVVASSLATQYFLVCIGAKQAFDNIQFVSDIKEILLTLPTIKDIDEAERARERLASFIQSRKKFFEKEIEDNSADGLTEISSVSYESYGKECKNGEFLFYTTSLEKILENELDFASAKAIIEKFARKGWLICGKGRNFRCNVRIHGKSTPVYRFKPNVFWSDKNSDSDKAQSYSA